MRSIMKLCLVIAIMGWVTTATAQSVMDSFKDPFRFPEENQVTGGLGMTWIDGRPYTTMTIAPDISIGKFGIGIYLQLLFDNNDGFKFRKEEYEDGAGILRAIRYLRLGQKYDPYYFRVGSLDRAMLANGFLVWNYTNMSSYDQRKIGLIADIDFSKFGFETVWSSVGTSNMRGINLYVRPFRLANTAIPILDRFRIYGTYVRDSKVTDLMFSVEGDTIRNPEVLQAFGIGADLQWLDLPILKSTVYADYGKIVDYGDGESVGINFILPEVLGLFALGARYEKRFIQDQFIPNMFGPLYELNRQRGLLTQLENTSKREGYFGELAGHILQKIRLIGNYQRLNGIDKSGRMHLEASAPDLVPMFDLRATYDKEGIETIKDARTLDENSLLSAEIGYELNKYLLLSAIYRWYWVEDPVDSGNFTTIERVEPRLSLRYNF